MTTKTFLFDEFFESGKEESISPFLTPDSRKWGKNLPLRGSFLAAFFLLLAFIVSFFPHHAPLSHLFLLFTYFLAGIPALVGAVEDIFSLEINIDVLMTLAAFLAVLIGSGMEGGLLLVLFAFSGSLERAVQTRARGALSTLKKLTPSKGSVLLPDGEVIQRSVKDIVPGTHLLIKAGEVVPLDGKVIAGSSSVNLAHLTGESLPVSKMVGDTVPSGASNLEGSLTIEVTVTNTDSTLAKIITLVTEAEKAKPKLQRWLDTLSNRYALTIILLSLLFALGLPFIFPMPFVGFEGSVYRSLAFLIAASPCALIIAIPIAYLSAISSCAKNGILLKGGVVLDALASCKQIALDKTGTLTSGDLTCIGLESINELLEKQKNLALSIAFGLEQQALHPIAQSIVSYAKKQNLKPHAISHFKFHPGYGVEGRVVFNQKEHKVFLGNEAFVKEKVPHEKWDALENKIAVAHENGEVLALFVFQQEPFIFRFKDQIRPQVKKTIHALTQAKIHTVMLTGDHLPSARSIALEAGIESFSANLRPEDKLSMIDTLANKMPLAMVGDGINDAPALARAHVGISMGKVGSKAAIDASDVVLLQDSVEKLPWLMKKANATTIIVKQNVILAASAILFATLPALLGWIPLWMAVLLHEGGTVIVGLNALRLLKK